LVFLRSLVTSELLVVGELVARAFSRYLVADLQSDIERHMLCSPEDSPMEASFVFTLCIPARHADE